MTPPTRFRQGMRLRFADHSLSLLTSCCEDCCLIGGVMTPPYNS